MTQMAGLVLCGGESRRMGRDKALLVLDGETLVLRVARTLAEVADPVLLAPGTLGRLGDMGFAEVEDAPPGAGPLAGIVAGLTASPHPLTAVAAVDMPFVSAVVFGLMLRLHGEEDAVVPVTDRGPQPLHALYSVSAREPLAAALEAGIRSVREALAGLRVRYVNDEGWRTADPAGRFALNLNRPEDLAAFEAAGTRKGARRRPSERTGRRPARR